MSSLNIGAIDPLRAAEVRRAEARVAQLRADLMRADADNDYRRAELAQESDGSADSDSLVDVYA